MTEKSFFRRSAIGIVFFWITLFVLIPNLLVIISSFLERDPAHFIRFVFSTESYRNLFAAVFFRIFLNSFKNAFIATLVCLLLSYPFAILLCRVRPSLRRYLLVLIIIPFWTSSLIRTYALVILLKGNGILNSLLMGAGLIREPLQILYSDFAVFCGLVYTLLPFMILPLYGNIEKLDIRMVEAAFDLGASRMQTFFRIILPLTMPGIIAGSILVFLPALGLFYIPDILGGAKSMLIGNFIRDQFLTARDWPFGAAASVILTAVMGFMLLAYYYSLKRFNAKLME
ncbi:MAG: spermidine/putrescine ABC transporter permease PotB [Desulfococcaceae bacterium]|jgi:spermidine/putrescine transport system permease protein|nr:spermidine/putrescine ABC transporter permease PotB [Desulfococcaceae bacterium]